MRTKNRYFILTAGMVAQFCAGTIYMWSVFRQPVATHLNWDLGAATLTSSIMLPVYVMGIIIGGYFQDKLGPRKSIFGGSFLIGCGMIATSFVTGGAPWLVYVTYGVIGSFGVGTVYMSSIASVQKWFPDRRGFASGMIVSAFGLSLVVFAPLANSMLGSLGVPATFRIFGICFLVVCIACALVIQNPPAGFLPKGYTPTQAVSDKRQYSPKEMFKTKQYYLLVGSMLFTLPAYFILNPVFLSLGADRGLTDALAIAGVSMTGISSAASRLLVAWASDKTGLKTAMITIMIVMLAAALAMTVARGVFFLVCIILISFVFGGASGVYAAMTAESFGTKHGGMNLGLVMLGYASSALIFPLVSNRLAADGNYSASFILASATCVLAIVLTLFLKDPCKEN